VRRLTKNDFKFERLQSFEIEQSVSYSLNLGRGLSKAVMCNVNLDIWDTLGQERHSSIVSAYFKNASGVMLVYDISSMDSFLSVISWIELLQEHFDLNPDKKGGKEESFILIGNKCDL
jgi:GTPase SAR1 family protein